MSDFLAQMARSSAARAPVDTRFSDDELDRPVLPLSVSGFAVIAELKNRSPAEGDLGCRADSRVDRALRYVYGGAAAISVLTEPERFDGDLAHLEEVAAAVTAHGVPVMRKDFLIDPSQILEARAAGASGVLLIAAMLDTKRLLTMLDCTFEHGMFVLLECFDETDLEHAVHVLGRAKYREQAESDKFLLGVNSRDLRTLEVDSQRLARFGPLLPAGVTAVAESGLRSGADAAAAAAAGYKMALVGTALMRADDPAALIAAMLAAGRAA